MLGTEEISGAERSVSRPEKKSGGGRGTLEKDTFVGERMWLAACLPKLDCTRRITVKAMCGKDACKSVAIARSPSFPHALPPPLPHLGKLRRHINAVDTEDIPTFIYEHALSKARRLPVATNRQLQITPPSALHSTDEDTLEAARVS